MVERARFAPNGLSLRAALIANNLYFEIFFIRFKASEAFLWIPSGKKRQFPGNISKDSFNKKYNMQKKFPNFFRAPFFPFLPVHNKRFLIVLQQLGLFFNSSLQSDFFMLFYSYWQNMMRCRIILTVNLLTGRKESPVFYRRTKPFIPTHDTYFKNTSHI